MIKWNFEKIDLDGAYKITPFFSDDNRGGFKIGFLYYFP